MFSKHVYYRKLFAPSFPFFPLGCTDSRLCLLFFFKKKEKTEGEKKEGKLAIFFFFNRLGQTKKQTRNRCYSFDTLIDEYFSFFMIFEDREIVKRKFQEFGQVVILKCVD